MDFKRVRTFVTVAEHGTRSRILHAEASNFERLRHAFWTPLQVRLHQPTGAFPAPIPWYVRLCIRKAVAWQLCG
jgi:hypothetical protein